MRQPLTLGAHVEKGLSQVKTLLPRPTWGLPALRTLTDELMLKSW